MHLSTPDNTNELVLGSTRLRVLVPAATTVGRYEILELRGEPGAQGPRPHYHRHADEAFIVLDGSLEMEVGGEKLTANAGTTVHVPKGTAHVFRYGAPGTRFLAILTPATRFEEYAEALKTLIAETGTPPDAARLATLMARHDQYLA